MAEFSEKVLSEAHGHSFKNKKELEKSEKCVCFHCFGIFNSKEVYTYLVENDGQETALCPMCMCDALIGDASGFDLTDQLIDELAYKYFRGLTRKDMEDFQGPEIIVLD